jgi:mRNA-degrading endonuclease HigB of HigAB toxin-antitoxin module
VRETEQQAENHRVEIKVYQQKVKHLEYEQATALKTAAGELEAESKGEEELHLKKEALLRRDKLALRARTRHLEEAQAEAARQTRLMQEKSLVKLRQEFRATLDALRAKYEGRLASLREDLTLRHRVEVHEVEERKNLHLNQLLRAHEQAFAEIKAYYNNITRANLELITTLKAQVAEANEKQAANQRLMLEIAEEKKRLSEPLRQALLLCKARPLLLRALPPRQARVPLPRPAPLQAPRRRALWALSAPSASSKAAASSRRSRYR